MIGTVSLRSLLFHSLIGIVSRCSYILVKRAYSTKCILFLTFPEAVADEDRPFPLQESLSGQPAAPVLAFACFCGPRWCGAVEEAMFLPWPVRTHFTADADLHADFGETDPSGAQIY